MVKRFAVMFLVFMLIVGAFMFMPEVSGEESDAINPYVVKGASGYISAAVVMFSGNTVLTYDRIAIMGFDLEAEIGSGMDLSMVNLTFGFDSGPAATSPVDVYAIDPFTGTGWSGITFTDEYINAQTPDDGHVFQLWQSGSYVMGEGFSETWQDQYDDNGTIYIGLAGWSFLTGAETYTLDMNELDLYVTYEAPPVLWAPTITSDSSGNDTVCFMDPYVYELMANESVTWSLESVTPPSGGNGDWLDIIADNGTVFGVPFPMCGPDGIGEYEVSVKAVSDEGTLAAWQNFTLTVTSKRGGGNLYEPFGTFELVEQQPGLYGWGTAVQNATLTWDVSDTDLYYGGFDADALEGYGWELSTVAYVGDELAIILTHNDTERTYGVYGKDDLESLNGTAAIQILDARITIGNSTIYARATNINVTAYYFGLTGVKVNGVPYGLDISLPEYSNVTLEFTTTLDDVAASLGYKVFIYSITYNDGAGFYSWWDGGAANDSAIQYKLTDVYGEYGNTVGMWVTPEGNYTEKLARATGTLRLTIREPYAPEITSTSMAPAYVREGYDFTFEAVETDLFILQYPAPSWATWDNATGRFTGTPGVDDLGVYMIVVYPYNTTDGITGDPFYAQFIVRPAAEAGDGIGFFGYVFSSIIALLFCLFLSISRDGFNATVFMALVPMAIAVLISVGAMPLWTIIVGILFYGILIFRNVGPGDSL